jgi:hypothetical protein
MRRTSRDYARRLQGARMPGRMGAWMAMVAICAAIEIQKPLPGGSGRRRSDTHVAW